MATRFVTISLVTKRAGINVCVTLVTKRVVVVKVPQQALLVCYTKPRTTGQETGDQQITAGRKTTLLGVKECF